MAFKGTALGRTSAAMALTLGLFASAALALSPGETVLQMGGANSQAAACIGCHGVDLKGAPDNGYPRLAGLPARYIVKQLHDFRSGERANAIMQPIAAALSEEEIAAVAQELGARARVNAPTPASAANPRPGTIEWLALRGDWSRKIPECVLCHGPSGVGVGDYFPPLAAQSALYLRTQLEAFRDRKADSGGEAGPPTRRNDINHLMGHIARSLTEEEVAGLAEYFGGLGDSSEPFDETRRRLR